MWAGVQSPSLSLSLNLSPSLYLRFFGAHRPPGVLSLRSARNLTGKNLWAWERFWAPNSWLWACVGHLLRSITKAMIEQALHSLKRFENQFKMPREPLRKNKSLQAIGVLCVLTLGILLSFLVFSTFETIFEASYFVSLFFSIAVSISFTLLVLLHNSTRCFFLLLVTQLCSRKGRSTLIAFTLFLAVTGPGDNLIKNFGALSNSFSCSQVWKCPRHRIVLNLISPQNRPNSRVSTTKCHKQFSNLSRLLKTR